MVYGDLVMHGKLDLNSMHGKINCNNKVVVNIYYKLETTFGY